MTGGAELVHRRSSSGLTEIRRLAADDMRFIFHNQKNLFVDGNCGGLHKVTRSVHGGQIRILDGFKITPRQSRRVLLALTARVGERVNRDQLFHLVHGAIAN